MSFKFAINVSTRISCWRDIFVSKCPIMEYWFDWYSDENIMSQSIGTGGQWDGWLSRAHLSWIKMCVIVKYKRQNKIHQGRHGGWLRHCNPLVMTPVHTLSRWTCLPRTVCMHGPRGPNLREHGKNYNFFFHWWVLSMFVLPPHHLIIPTSSAPLQSPECDETSTKLLHKQHKKYV